ncbi:MAG: hypothetical protein GW855_03020 [Erythrobacter sp.]|nr:hypothetical protein [Erythrobacter sp.]NCQ65137.1 hypothetical protein [Alphaproteobacteria bacterium]
MNMWTAIVIIVLIGAAVKLLRDRHLAQNGITQDMLGNQTLNHTPRDNDEAEAEIAALKERIAVLERIAYDKNSTTARESDRIAAEIDALREQQD